MALLGHNALDAMCLCVDAVIMCNSTVGRTALTAQWCQHVFYFEMTRNGILF